MYDTGTNFGVGGGMFGASVASGLFIMAGTVYALQCLGPILVGAIGKGVSG